MGRLLLTTLTTTVVATACPLPREGDPGTPFFELSVQIEDEDGGAVASSEWTTPRGPHRVVTEQRSELERDFFAIYESPPAAAFIGGVARLDVFYGDAEDIFDKQDDDDLLARTRIAVTRTTLWCSERSWRDVDADAVPFDIAALDDDEVFGDDFKDGTGRVVLFIDSPNSAARRCGDDVQATCEIGCDIVTGTGDAACCAAAHDALLACEALVVSTQGVARLQRPSR